MNKNDQRKVMIFFVALSFSVARKCAGVPSNSAENLVEGRLFVEEAERAGINIGELLSDDRP